MKRCLKEVVVLKTNELKISTNINNLYDFIQDNMVNKIKNQENKDFDFVQLLKIISSNQVKEYTSIISTVLTKTFLMKQIQKYEDLNISSQQNNQYKSLNFDVVYLIMKYLSAAT